MKPDACSPISPLRTCIHPWNVFTSPVERQVFEMTSMLPIPDFSSIRGHVHAKRALEVAACGGHHLALIGGPGSGKTLVARALRGILPPYGQGLVRPVVEGQEAVMWIEEALRGYAGSLSHALHGVLFLDRLDCFDYSVLQIQRIATVFDQIADVQLVLTAQPCPCGWYGDPLRDCRCSPRLIQRFQQRLCALLERIAITVELPPLDDEQHLGTRSTEASVLVAKRVRAAVQWQQRHYSGQFSLRNASMDHAQILRWCHMDASAQKLYRAAHQQLRWSARTADAVLTVARTIADLAESEDIQANHLAEAIGYQSR